MNKSQKRLLIIFGLLMLVGLILLGVILGWFYRRGWAFDSRPLVLIHTPFHNEKIPIGERIMVHATAREDEGLARIELWVNGSLADELVAEEPNPINLVLFSSWTPTFVGHHELIVQAVSSGGINGQSTISVFAEEAGQTETEVDLGQEDAATGTSVDDEVSSADSAAASSETVDDSTGTGSEPDTDEGPGPSEEDRDSPFPEDDAPLTGVMFETFEMFTPPPGRIPLRIEIPRLQTGASFDGLHCYVSLAGSLPQWYPDLDHDQATDESFEPLEGGRWNTESTLVGSNAPVILWPEDQSLPISVSCVGVNGGTEAANYRRTDLEVPSENWNGVQHEYETDGESGPLYFSVSISRLESIPRDVPKRPDPTMTSPTNVRLNESARTLEWDYEPETDEEIDGFRIYLNDNLQWTEPADARESRLPREWFNPPCASTYTFGVTAFRLGFPDGRESLPGTVDLVQPREDCTRRIQVFFLELETYELGDDGDRGEINGDRGPAYGAFYANDQRIEFNGGGILPGGWPIPEGLQDNTVYQISNMVGDPNWNFYGPNHVTVDLPRDATIRVGFNIIDRDGGRCSDPSEDPGCDDILCSGTLSPIRDDAFHNLDGINQETITADNGRCRVRIEYRPAYDSPVGSRGEGGEPLPWVEIIDFSVDEHTGEVALEVINGGTAEWSGRDLVIGLQNRERVIIGLFTFEDFVLRPGDRTVLRHPMMILDPPYDACVIVDPFDDVEELYERNEVMFHNSICPRIPDLEIIDVYYKSTYGHYIRAVVQNTGEGVIDNRTFEFNVQDYDGHALIDRYRVPGVSMGTGEIHIFEFPELDDATRDRMAAGYSVILDPERTIFEQNVENNWYQISAAERLEIFIRMIEVPYAVRDLVEFELDAYVVSGREQVQVLNRNIRQDIDWDSCSRDRYCVKDYNDIEYANPPFIISGDQELKIDIRVDHPGSLWQAYVISERFPGPTWGGVPVSRGSCKNLYRDTGTHDYEFDYHNGFPWYLWFNICEDIEY